MEYFRHLRNRLHFPTMQYFCRQLQLPTAQGWDKLEEKLEEASEESPARRREISAALEKIFKRTIPIGHRVVQVFRLKEPDLTAIAEYFSRLQAEESPYAETYPVPLTTRQLATAQAGAFLTKVRKGDDSVTLIFCAKRLIEEREQRSRADIGSKAISAFGWQEYDEFIFIKRRQVQVYEVVRVDVHSGLVELRVEDHTGLDFDAAMNELRMKANELLATKFGDSIQLINPVNLFPAIFPIYNDPEEGIVIELGFTTLTGSAKHEKMRQRSLDLREEKFHVGGKAAILGALTPFRIAVRWPATEEHGQEEVTLPGSIRQLGTDSPQLDHMLIRGPLTESDMRSCIKRVVAHLPAE